MPFHHIIQSLDMNGKDREQLSRELTSLRTELDDIRTKYTSLLAKLDADVGVTDVNYASLGVLAAATFTRL